MMSNQLVIIEEGQTFEIGRSQYADIVVDDYAVNRFHCRVWCKEGQVWISDRGSKCGTYVNGQQIRGEHKLAADDTVEIGWSNSFSVRIGTPE